MGIRDGLAWLAALLAGLGVIGLVLGPGWRRPLGVACAVLLLPVPFVAPVAMPLRWPLAFFCAWAVLRSIELAHRGVELPAWRRAVHMVTVFDTRAAQRVPRRLRWEQGVRFVGFSSLAAAALWIALRGGAGDVVLSTGLRWAGGAVFAYAGMDAAIAAALLLAGLVGVEVPAVHDDPILSRSVREFWGARWNLVVHAWLRTHVFEPTRRGFGVGVAVLVTFAASAAHHAYFFWPSAGLVLSASVALFFLAQLGLLGLESVLAVRRWPALAARGFTLVAIGVTTPLAVEPALRVIESALALSW